MKRVVEKDMACSRVDFLRILPRALGSNDFSAAGDVFTYVRDGRTFSITHQVLADRTLGGLAIPRAAVRLELEGFSDEEAQQAIDRFDRYFHRGGG